MNDQIPNEGNEEWKLFEGDAGYIPLDPSRRERSFRLWEEVGHMCFGRDFPEAYIKPPKDEPDEDGLA